MSEKLQVLLKEIQSLEKAVEEELHRAQDKVTYTISEGKVSFSKEISTLHRSLKINLARYIYESDLLFIISAPVIYSMIIPALITDFFCIIYQTICFPVYRITKVDRSLYIQFDRHKLAYLNGVEKLNCEFCAYFNGVLSFAGEIASRTEQYWCPIRHALAVKGVHKRYQKFSKFGDADEYRKKLTELRKELEKKRSD